MKSKHFSEVNPKQVIKCNTLQAMTGLSSGVFFDRTIDFLYSRKDEFIEEIMNDPKKSN